MARANKYIAICYDFDKTLSPRDMQEQGLFDDLGYSAKEFWKITDELANSCEMDYNLAYMLKILQVARERGIFVTREYLQGFGKKIELYPGLASGEWFDALNSHANKKGYTLEHYVISSGLKEIISGTEIYPQFKKVYASEYYFDDRGAIWPLQNVNYTAKTQFLFRIKKGLESSNSLEVNNFFPKQQIHIPFSHFIYIGDSDTDIPCMKIINSNAGWTIGIFDNKTKDRTKVDKLLSQKRLKLAFPSDYSKTTPLCRSVKRIIDKIALDDSLFNNLDED